MGQLAGLAGIIRSGMAQVEDEEPAAETVVEAKPLRTAARRAKPNVKPGAAAALEKPVTKSKDPAWKAYSLFLKKDTHSEMNFILRRLDAGEDMSDLVQRLVEGWVKSNR